MKKKLQNILRFLHVSEGLKRELRHSWLSDGRQESVAEHTWRMALMALVLYREVDRSLDIRRVVLMILIHDLGEIYTGDYQVYGKPVPVNKHILEKKALTKLMKDLPVVSRREIRSLWNEFERRSTREAKFAAALDKLEVLVQHNEADVTTYLEGEGVFNLTFADAFVQYSKPLALLRELIRQETKRKISQR